MRANQSAISALMGDFSSRVSALEAYPELGYPKITRLLNRDSWELGKRLVQCLRQKMGLRCPSKQPRRRLPDRQEWLHSYAHSA